MENILEDGDYEIVDECTEEEETNMENVQNEIENDADIMKGTHETNKDDDIRNMDEGGIQILDECTGEEENSSADCNENRINTDSTDNPSELVKEVVGAKVDNTVDHNKNVNNISETNNENISITENKFDIEKDYCDDDVQILQTINGTKKTGNSDTHENHVSVETCPLNAAAYQGNISSIDNTIDFTEDISLDSLKKRKPTSRDDDIVCLGESNSQSSFVIQEEEQNQEVESIGDQALTNQSEDSVILNEEREDERTETDQIYDKIYEEKLAHKVSLVKERLSKLARVLEYSYPVYHNWLHKVYLSSGTSVCKLEPPRRCPLNQPYINRWKFICSKTRVHEEANKEGTAAATSYKTTQRIWQLALSNVSESNNDDCPAYVMRAVKVFEEFIQSVAQMPVEEIVVDDETTDTNTEDADKQKMERLKKPEWVCLLVRCNRKSELMLFASGKNVNSSIMESLKDVYTTGPGKNCNVKSLYCKSISRVNNVPQTNTTFLVGSETLDEVVQGIKVQLAPKTNFWLNTDGVEVLATAIKDLLAPNQKTTVVEIGCGIGLIGLTLASRCHKVIGLDSPSEIEEAEMMCEINNIKNASFVTGQPKEVMTTIAKVLANNKATAIINANTNIARAIDVMINLRKINSLRRLVMVTTLTKQSVRSILELTRPASAALGNPFIPVRAYIVDTLPYGSDFEIVILMERRMMQTLLAPIPQYLLEKAPKIADTEASAVTSVTVSETATASTTTGATATDVSSTETTIYQDGDKVKPASPKKGNKVDSPKKSGAVNKTPTKPVNSKSPNKPLSKKSYVKKKTIPQPFKKNVTNPFHANKFKGKRVHSPDKFQPVHWKASKKFRPWQVTNKPSVNNKGRGEPLRKASNQPVIASQPRNKPEISLKRKREWVDDGPVLRVNPIAEKKLRDEQVPREPDLRERLSNSRVDVNILQKVKEQQKMLDMAKEKMSAQGSNIDPNTAKQLQNMLNMVIEETNKLQSQLPLSVWDRIAPPANTNASTIDDSSLRGSRFVQETAREDIRVTAMNDEYAKGYSDIQTFSNTQKTSSVSRQFQENYRRQHEPLMDNQWNKNDDYHKNPMPSMRPVSPLRHRAASPPMKRLSPRPVMPSRGNISPKRQMSPTFQHRPRPMSPGYRQRLSPPRQQMQQQQPPSSQQLNLRPVSPPRNIRRPYKSPPRNTRFSPPHSSQQGRFMSSSSGPVSLRQSSPRRQMSPGRFMDDWDIPTRGAVEKNIAMRPMDNRALDNRWKQGDRRNDQGPSWQIQGTSDDRFRKPLGSDDSSWDIRGSSNITAPWRTSGNANDWNKQSSSTMNPSLSMKDDRTRPSTDMRWLNNDLSGGRSIGDTWTIREKESFSISDTRRDDFRMMDKQQRWDPLQKSNMTAGRNQVEKEDWNDLPEDARDPWADDSNTSTKDRWHTKPFDSINFSSTFQRDKEPLGDDKWRDSGNNWQNRNMSINNKSSQWQPTTNLNLSESRWKSSNDNMPRFPQTGAQSGLGNISGNMTNWQSKTFSTFSQQRPSFNLGSLGSGRR